MSNVRNPIKEAEETFTDASAGGVHTRDFTVVEAGQNILITHIATRNQTTKTNALVEIVKVDHTSTEILLTTEVKSAVNLISAWDGELLLHPTEFIRVRHTGTVLADAIESAIIGFEVHPTKL